MAQTSAPASASLSTLTSGINRWQHRKNTSGIPLRLSMRLLEVIALAASMFVLPAGVHYIVQVFDETYEIVGRRARSPYDASLSGISIAIAGLLSLAWHLWLGRLSYTAIMEEQRVVSNGDEQTRKISWGRILGRIVIPTALLSLGVHFTIQFVQRIGMGPFVTSNVIDAKEVEMDLKGRS
ncbi:hypothetical protein FB567DRAFT_78585 [Paraphoma chrysanthemicola]|uniref:Uncharacterized protein n=1 Tax=Paraphoma chrysanthemicola TaxID=798071 RepID=A0A8K0R330_9PLEO|nr:hypothetical protein FB567DRAFT_78585 [Paraphoma chrysanthemicola]